MFFKLNISIIFSYALDGADCGKKEKEISKNYFSNAEIDLKMCIFRNLDLTRAPLGGGFLGPPSRFFAITREIIDASSPNFVYLLPHQFDTWCPKIMTLPMIGRRQMTST